MKIKKRPKIVLVDKSFCPIGIFGLAVALCFSWFFKDSILLERALIDPVAAFLVALVILILFNSVVYTICLLFCFNVRPLGWLGLVWFLILFSSSVFIDFTRLKLYPSYLALAFIAISIMTAVHLVSADFLRES